MLLLRDIAALVFLLLWARWQLASVAVSGAVWWGAFCAIFLNQAGCLVFVSDFVAKGALGLRKATALYFLKPLLFLPLCLVVIINVIYALLLFRDRSVAESRALAIGANGSILIVVVLAEVVYRSLLAKRARFMPKR
jgi:hypothetical protein